VIIKILFGAIMFILRKPHLWEQEFARDT